MKRRRNLGGGWEQNPGSHQCLTQVTTDDASRNVNIVYVMKKDNYPEISNMYDMTGTGYTLGTGVTNGYLEIVRDQVIVDLSVTDLKNVERATETVRLQDVFTFTPPDSIESKQYNGASGKFDKVTYKNISWNSETGTSAVRRSSDVNPVMYTITRLFREEQQQKYMGQFLFLTS